MSRFANSINNTMTLARTVPWISAGTSVQRKKKTKGLSANLDELGDRSESLSNLTGWLG